MTPEQAVRDRLVADATVAALVSTRIYPLAKMPQNVTLPALSFLRVSGRDPITNDGRSGLQTVRLQLDAWADSYRDMVELAEATKAALHGVRWTATGVAYAVALFDSDRDLPEEPALRGERRIERRSADYMVSFRAAA